jgi:hypothetical protein
MFMNHMEHIIPYFACVRKFRDKSIVEKERNTRDTTLLSRSKHHFYTNGGGCC